MNKLKTFFHILIKSHTDIDYYQDVVRASYSFSFKYFLIYYLILALATSLYFNFHDKPNLQNTSSTLIQQAKDNFPQDLSIKLESGILSLQGQDQPFHIEFPPTLDQFQTSTKYQYLATFDTSSNTAAKDSLLTLTTQDIIVRQPDGLKQTIPLSNLDANLEINNSNLEENAQIALDVTTTLISALPYLLFLFLITIYPIIALLFLAFFSILTNAIAKILGKKLTYKKTFQIGLHTITFAETADFIHHLTTPNLNFPNFFTLAFLASTLIVILFNKKLTWPTKHEQEKVHAQTFRLDFTQLHKLAIPQESTIY